MRVSQKPAPLKTVLVIGNGELLNQLPQALANDELAVDLYDVPTSFLQHSKFIRNFYPLDKKADEPLQKAVFRNRKWLYQQNYDYYILADDLAVIDLARKTKDVELQLRLLPVRKIEGIPLPASKVGFVNIANQAGIKIPKSFVAKNNKEIAKLSREFEAGYLVKADIGGGGSTVKKFKGVFDPIKSEIPKPWFPVVVQEEIEGLLISVEGLYDSGDLLGWIYSKFDTESWEFGPSTRRTFFDPPSFDFEEPLIQLGRVTGFHGFANTTFIWNETDKSHYLFEADNRPNGWHQFAHRFGIDWGKLFVSSDRTAIPVRPVIPNGAVTFSLFPREPLYAISKGKFKPVWFWIKRNPGTWNARNTRDEVVNEAEVDEVRAAIKNWALQFVIRPRNLVRNGFSKLHHALAKLFVSVWQSIPLATRNRLEALGLKKLLVFIFRV